MSIWHRHYFLTCDMTRNIIESCRCVGSLKHEECASGDYLCPTWRGRGTGGGEVRTSNKRHFLKALKWTFATGLTGTTVTSTFSGPGFNCPHSSCLSAHDWTNRIGGLLEGEREQKSTFRAFCRWLDWWPQTLDKCWAWVWGMG